MNASFLGRHSVRIPGFDYTTPGYYFITINSFHREHCFGQLKEEAFHTSSTGEIILDCWVKIPQHFLNASCDANILMPDHFHGILELIAKSGYGRKFEYGHEFAYGHEFEYGHDISCPYAVTNQESFGQPVPGSIPTIIRTFKAAVTRQVGRPVFQRGYYEHIIRDYEDLDRIRNYITTQYLRTIK